MSENTVNYKETICLPQTTFPMKGNLVNKEPERLQGWEESKIYDRILAKRRAAGAERYILHDGPPFANGDVHMGTALNKVLKDFVVKSKSMAGFEVPFVPGWDCHGLPIEFKVMQDARDKEPAEIRTLCEEFARKWIEIQKASFRRLGVFGDWENPYLTMAPNYEADILRVFAKLVDKDRVYLSKKPVQWSYGARTALAEAEVEYQDKKSTAVYVPFALLGEKFPGASMVIWTTTPWTLPANLGIAVHERFVYVVGSFEKDGVTRELVVARDLVDQFGEKTGWVAQGELKEISGKDLEGLEAQHPFLDRTSKVIFGGFVTAETGTGAVHIAPGHGADDYVAGLANGLEVLSPVDDGGLFTDECGVPELVGQHVFKCNGPIVEMLTERDAILGDETYEHQYPFCWRSKTPIIFRAVEQFFISLDGIREKAMEEIDKVNWLPHWGRNRIYGTVEARPDWCISRQRTWGVPLPVFFGPDGQALLNADTVRKIADIVAEKGTNVWFEKSDEEWVADLGLPAGSKKATDTLDVWIDSGSSHVAVMAANEEVGVPADLYLEATDQHRGWFQSSLMLSVGYRDKAPYKNVMTHGFVVDKDTGKKTSKSDDKKKGKPTDAAHFYNKYGADILRMWVSSVDWQNEVPFGEDLFQQVGDPYRRLRNTFKILLGNLHGFDPATMTVAPEEMTVIDRWVLERLHVVVSESLKAYENFEFRKVFSAVNQFCAHDLSSLYIDMTKDRLYCDAENDIRRRASQTALYEVFDSLVRLLAPIIAFTSEEAWEHAGREGSVHEQTFPKPDERFASGEATGLVTRLLEIRDTVQVAIEPLVQAKEFKKNNEAKVVLTVPSNHPCLSLLEDPVFVKEFFIVAEMVVEQGDTLKASASKSEHAMCPRCRRYEPIVDEAGLCGRCHEVTN
ncbi:MAG: isoleucine--tRNA ligase [Roseibacillus sp.]